MPWKNKRQGIIAIPLKETRNCIKKLLESQSDFEFNLFEAGDVEEARQLSNSIQYPIHLLVTAQDFRTPDKQGLEVLKAFPFARVKMVLAEKANIPDCVAFIRAGAHDYLDAATPLPEILAKVVQALRNRNVDGHEPTNEELRAMMDAIGHYSGELLAFIHGKMVAHHQNEKKLRSIVQDIFPGEKPFVMLAPVEIY